MRRTIRMIVWLILASQFIACGRRGESDNSDSTEELIENEIWNPLIILSREESRVVAAKAEKLYQSSNSCTLTSSINQNSCATIPAPLRMIGQNQRVLIFLKAVILI